MKTRRKDYRNPENDREERREKKRKLPKKTKSSLYKNLDYSNNINFDQETNNLFRQVRYKFKRRKIRCFYQNELAMMDTINYRAYGKQNDGFRYIMVYVDCFSKVCFAEPMKRLDELSSLLAIENIFKRLDEYPRYIVSDRGNEFMCARVQHFFQTTGVMFYNLRGQHKASIAERMIRTLKTFLEKFFWQNHKKRWIDVLQSFVTKYNNTYHRSIRMKPSQVSLQNRDRVFRNLFPEIKRVVKPRLEKNSLVRIVKTKGVFEKGYSRRWSREIFTIISAKTQNGVDYYRLKDTNSNILPRAFYYWELNPQTNDISR